MLSQSKIEIPNALVPWTMPNCLGGPIPPASLPPLLVQLQSLNTAPCEQISIDSGTSVFGGHNATQALFAQLQAMASQDFLPFQDLHAVTHTSFMALKAKIRCKKTAKLICLPSRNLSIFRVFCLLCFPRN